MGDSSSVQPDVCAQRRGASEVLRPALRGAAGRTKALTLCHHLLLGMHTMDNNKRSRVESSDKAIAIYHVVYAHEGFEESAQTLFTLVREAQRLQPGKQRKLYLDIEGHRQSAGGFDPDMVELQQEFLLGFLSPYLAEIHAPLVRATNTQPQENELPPALVIQAQREAKM
jgi:hypothetical protein